MCLPKANWWAWVRPIPIDRGRSSARLEDQIAPKHDEVAFRTRSGKMWAIRGRLCARGERHIKPTSIVIEMITSRENWQVFGGRFYTT